MYRFWLQWGVNQLFTMLHSRDMVFSLFSATLATFLTPNGWLWGWYWSLEFPIFQNTIEMHQLRLKWGVNQLLTMWHSRNMVFSPFSAILAIFSQKWLILRVTLKSRVFNISIYNRNASILVRMRGESASDDVAFPRYGIFPYFQPF